MSQKCVSGRREKKKKKRKTAQANTKEETKEFTNVALLSIIRAQEMVLLLF